jgi:hypothetical protein
MHKLVPVVVLIATASTFCHASVAAELRFASPQDHAAVTDALRYRGVFLLVAGSGSGAGGGMGGTPGGGMGGTPGGGMGGTPGGGMGGTPGGGMGGTPGGGMGGVPGGGMGGVPGGGMENMPAGNMTGTTSPSTSGATGYSGAPGGDPYSRSETTSEPLQSPKYYHCITQNGQCSVSSTLGALRSGASCSCLFGGKGKIK